MKKAKTKQNIIHKTVLNEPVVNESNINMGYHTLPWVEKYRPKKIKDLLAGPIIISEINTILKNKDIPHMILTGSPGIGKTTTLLCLARELYGPYTDTAVLELNASDDRGIKSLNNLVYGFCTKMIPYLNNKDVPYAKHKLIIFDEADNMTEKALPIISALMDKFHKTVRFVFTCNSSTKIIESIQSRCKILRYERLSPEMVLDRLKFICKREGVKYDMEALNEIHSFSNGDMRNSINLLQLVFNRYGEITKNNIYEVTDRPQLSVIKDLILSAQNKKLNDGLNIIKELRTNGFSCGDILSVIFNIVKTTEFNFIKEEFKMRILLKTAEYLYDTNRLLDTDLALTAYVIDINHI